MRSIRWHLDIDVRLHYEVKFNSININAKISRIEGSKTCLILKAPTKSLERATALLLRGLRGLPILAGQYYFQSGIRRGDNGDAGYGSAPLSLLHQFFPQHLSDRKPGTG